MADTLNKKPGVVVTKLFYEVPKVPVHFHFLREVDRKGIVERQVKTSEMFNTGTYYLDPFYKLINLPFDINYRRV